MLSPGPIDISAEAEGTGRNEGYRRAPNRFVIVLPELVSELPPLRQPVSDGLEIRGPIPRNRVRAVLPTLPKSRRPCG